MAFEVKDFGKEQKPKTDVTANKNELLTEPYLDGKPLNPTVEENEVAVPEEVPTPTNVEPAPQEQSTVIPPQKTPTQLTMDAAKVRAEMAKKQEALAKRREQTRVSTIQIPYSGLVSQGLPYPPKGKVSYDTYSFLDMTDLNASRLAEEDKYEIILAGIHVEDFEPDPDLNTYNFFYGDSRDLTFFDFLQISMLRKMSNAKVNKFTVPYFCKKCKQELEHVFTLEDIGFNSLETPSLPICITLNNGTELEFYPLTIGRYLEIAKTDLFYRYMPDGTIMLDEYGNPVRNTVAFLAAMVINMDFGNAYECIANLTDLEDIDLINLIDVELAHGVLPLEFKCPARLGEIVEDEEEKDKEIKLPLQFRDKRPVCNQVIQIKLREVEDMIVPFREPRGSAKDRIHFGRKRNS